MPLISPSRFASDNTSSRCSSESCFTIKPPCKSALLLNRGWPNARGQLLASRTRRSQSVARRGWAQVSLTITPLLSRDELPNEWDQSIGDLLLVLFIACQFIGQHFFFANDPAHQEDQTKQSDH